MHLLFHLGAGHLTQCVLYAREVLYLSETKSYCVTQAGLKLNTLLSYLMCTSRAPLTGNLDSSPLSLLLLLLSSPLSPQSHSVVENDLELTISLTGLVLMADLLPHPIKL